MENVYDYTVIETSPENYGEGLACSGGRIYYLSYSENGGEWTQTYVSVDENGGDEREFPITKSLGNDAYIGGCAFADDGTLWYAETSYDYDELTGEADQKIVVHHCGAGGEEISAKDISADINGGNYGIGGIVPLSDGRAAVAAGGSVALVGDDGSLKVTETDCEYIDSMFKDRSGGLFIVYYDNSGPGGHAVRAVDAEAGRPGEKKDVPQIVKNNSYNIVQGAGYDLCFYSETALYGYDFGDESPTEICSWINSDVSFTYLNRLIVCPDGRIIAIPQSDSDGGKIYIMTKRPDELNEEKFLLTLGCVYLDSTVRGAVADFNRTSAEYRIVVKDYSQYIDEDDWQAGYNRLNQDIISGSSPDLIAVNAETPYLNYVSKGVFEPLNKYLDGKNGVDRSKYLDNIFRACEIDGELYSVIPAFAVSSVACRRSLAEKALGRTGITSVTVDDCVKILESAPGARSFRDMTKEELASIISNYLADSFIDYDTGKCSFDSPEFIELLGFSKYLPDKSLYDGVDWDAEGEDFWEEYDAMFRSGKCVFGSLYLGGYEDFWQQYKGTFDGDMAMVGWPAAGSAGTVINPAFEIAVSSSSAFKDQAWEFIRVMLGEEWQGGRLDFCFPVLRSALADKRGEAMKAPGDDAEKEADYGGWYWLGSERIYIGHIDRETADMLDACLTSLDRVSRCDDGILTIIQEELSSYLSGAKSAEETAKLIQNRAQTYISEQM